jgi:predicted ATPase
MNPRKNNSYVLTGGPGVGKTTLLNELAIHGYKIIPENAREIIKHEVENNGDGLPWGNKIRYTQLMFDAAIRSFNSVPLDDTKTYFFDRGILDTICYANMTGFSVSVEMDNIIKKSLYNKKVFILPPWEEIYHTDSERKQTFEEVKLTFIKMKETYLNYNYEIIEVPIDTVENRVIFIMNKINR